MAAIRASMSVAVVCMVNHTAVKELALPEGNWSKPDEDSVKFSSKWSLGHKSKYQEGSFIWSKETQDLILSSIFWGYLVTSFPAGMIVSKYGGRVTFGTTTAVSTVATLLIPIASTAIPYLVITLRFITGLCQGFALPAISSLMAAWAPPFERSRLTVIAIAGAKMGTIVDLALSGVFCEYLGWPSIFYTFGGLSCVWCFCWFFIAYDTPEQHPRISAAEKKYIQDSLTGQMEKNQLKVFVSKDVPWSRFIKSGPIWALNIGYFCFSWLNFAFLVVTPSYINDVLKLGIESIGIYSSICSVMMWVFLILSGFTSDFLIKKYPDKITLARKIFFSVGMIASSTFIFSLGFIDCFHVSLALVLLIAGRAALGCPCSVIFCNQVDIAPKYAGLLVGVASTFSSASGLLGPAIAGIMTEHQTREEWQLFLCICAGVGVFGALVYLVIGSGEVQPWAKIDSATDKELQNISHNQTRDENSKLTNDSKKIYN
ncbi:sialin-like [Tubulanus polymorphus]|uniref:sialin-like n=1 Tax=Tubulanus polymorphus TaxID=672921 RepID=UPI003DA3E38B